MKKIVDPWVEKCRVRYGRLASSSAIGNNGAFLIPRSGVTIKVIVSDGEGWDHVSVSLPNRCPIWDEMCHIKDLFWGPEELVMQLHVPASEHINCHPYCLHMWRPQKGSIPIPHWSMVGPKAEQVVR